MDPKSLIERSPLRALDDVLEGDLGKGDLGIVVARHGAGKTPFIVCVALDHLLRGERVLHVSLDQKVDHVREFYDQIFDEIVSSAKVDGTAQVHLEMERARHIHTYLGNTFTADKLKSAIAFMRDHASFTPDLILLDGYECTKDKVSEVEALVEAARACGATLWMTSVRHREDPVTDPDGIPSPAAVCKQHAKVIVEMRTTEGKVRISLLKPAGRSAGDGELPFVLDPTTMLIRKK